MSNNIREIYTKAIVAKGKKLSKCTYSFVINDKPNEILGCWITNHRYEAIIKNKIPKVIGSFDVHVWYSLNDHLDSCIAKHTMSYVDDMQVSKKEDRDFENSDIVKSRCLTVPKCLNSYIEDKKIIVEIEKEMQIEISGETCIKVEVKTEEEIWDDFDDIQINPHFIK